MALGVLSGNLPLLFADCGGRVVEGCAVTQDLFDLIGPFGGKNGQDIYIKSLTQQFLEELHKCKRRSASTTGVGLWGNASQRGAAKLRCGYSGKPTFLRRAGTLGSPRSRANSGELRAWPIRAAPSPATRSKACNVRSLSPKPA